MRLAATPRVRVLAVATVAALTLALAPAPAWARSVAVQSYAVLDFATAEKRADVDPWSFGLADFFTAALSERGAPVLERRALRSVLSERELAQLGLTSQPALREKLPQVRYLVKGVVDAAGGEGDRFRLSISVLDTERGASALELSGDGLYPHDVAEVLDDLAEQVLATLPGRGAAAPRPGARLWGMTGSPDVAVQFYKGLDHIAHGRPEFAAEYFRQAHLADRSFWLAVAWRMRAYEALGLRDVAAYVRDLVLESPEGRGIFQALAPSLALQRDELLVTLARSPDADADTRALEQRVAEALVAQPGIGLFSAAWIRDLADELDLRLSGEFAPRALERTPWLAVDAVVRVRRESNALHLELLDALTGEPVARVETASAPDDARATQLVARLAEQPRERLRGPLRPLQPLDYEVPPGDIATYTRQGYAYLLRDFADHPADPVRLARHLEVHGIHSYAYHVPGTYDREWRYLELLWQHLIANVDLSDPNAPNWLSLALWNLRLHGSLGDADLDHPRTWFNRGRHLLPLEHHFAPLLLGFPDSLAALCVRHAIGLEHLKRGRSSEAAETLIEVADALAQTPREAGGPYLTDRALASVYFVTAIAAKEAGQPDAAARFARRAARAAEGTPEGWSVEPIVPAVSYIVPGRGGHTNGAWGVSSMSKTVFVNGQLRHRKQEPLEGAIARLAAGDDRPHEPSLGDLYARALRQQGAAGVDARLSYLRRLVDELDRGPKLHLSVTYGRPLDTLIPWLDQHVPDERRGELESVVRELVEGLRDRSKPYRLRDELIVKLLAAAQLDDEIEAIAAAGLGSQSPTDRSMGAIAKARLLAVQAGRLRAARFLESELDRFERDFAQSRDRHYLDLVYVCGEAYEEAPDLGRAAAIYRRALDAPLFATDGAEWAARNAPPHRASLRFLLARVERERGNPLAAADLYKQVIESAEAHPDWMLHYSGSGARSIGTSRLYRAAVQELRELRTPPASL